MASPADELAPPEKKRVIVDSGCPEVILLTKISEMLGSRFPSYMRLLKCWFYKKESNERLENFVNEVSSIRTHFGLFEAVNTQKLAANLLKMLKASTGEVQRPVQTVSPFEKWSRMIKKLPDKVSRDIVLHVSLWAYGVSEFGGEVRELLIDAVEVEIKRHLEEMVRISRFHASITMGNEPSPSDDSSKVIKWRHFNDLREVIAAQCFCPRPRIAY